MLPVILPKVQVDRNAGTRMVIERVILAACEAAEENERTESTHPSEADAPEHIQLPAQHHHHQVRFQLDDCSVITLQILEADDMPMSWTTRIVRASVIHPATQQ